MVGYHDGIHFQQVRRRCGQVREFCLFWVRFFIFEVWYYTLGVLFVFLVSLIISSLGCYCFSAYTTFHPHYASSESNESLMNVSSYPCHNRSLKLGLLVFSLSWFGVVLAFESCTLSSLVNGLVVLPFLILFF